MKSVKTKGSLDEVIREVARGEVRRCLEGLEKGSLLGPFAASRHMEAQVWTKEEDSALMQWAVVGVRMIAAFHGRSPGAVWTRLLKIYDEGRFICSVKSGVGRGEGSE